MDLNGYAMDIGGTRARVYQFESGKRISELEIDLPEIDSNLSQEDNSASRVAAIARLVKYFATERQVERIATACAGKKNPSRTGVTTLFFAVPLPDLVPTVLEKTGVHIGPLFDDDVAAAWGHLVSPRSPLQKDEHNTLLLTSGTGLAEAHFVEGDFVDKNSYIRASELNLEQKLRAAAWRDDGDPTEAVCELVAKRRELYPISRLILAGRFVHMDRDCLQHLQDKLKLEAHLVELGEAPALGALHLLQASVNPT